MLSDGLQGQLVLASLKDAGIAADAALIGRPVRIKSGVNDGGHALHYLLNYSSQPETVPYRFGAARDLLTGHALQPGATVTLAPWDLVIAEETAPAPTSDTH